MKNKNNIFCLFFLIILIYSSVLFAAENIRPIATYSIVAVDKETGQMGVAVQSHWFSVGFLVPWIESGIGAVATQSFVKVDYGPDGLKLMKQGKTAEESLRELIQADENESVRQVAMVDIHGNVAVHTGKNCIPEAGHITGKGYSCQANLMLKDTVWKAMADAFENTPGELVERLLAALEAAEREGGDIRGRQSAAIIVAKMEKTEHWWEGILYNLRVEDHPDPVRELKRLVRLNQAYNHMNRGDELLTEGKITEAMEAYTRAMNMYPDNSEMIFWPAVTLASTGKVEESLPLFKKVFAIDNNWAILVPRLPGVGQLPDNKELIKKILSVAPQKKD